MQGEKSLLAKQMFNNQQNDVNLITNSCGKFPTSKYSFVFMDHWEQWQKLWMITMSKYKIYFNLIIDKETENDCNAKLQHHLHDWTRIDTRIFLNVNIFLLWISAETSIRKCDQQILNWSNQTNKKNWS